MPASRDRRNVPHERPSLCNRHVERSWSRNRTASPSLGSLLLVAHCCRQSALGAGPFWYPELSGAGGCRKILVRVCISAGGAVIMVGGGRVQQSAERTYCRLVCRPRCRLRCLQPRRRLRARRHCARGGALGGSVRLLTFNSHSRPRGQRTLQRTLRLRLAARCGAQGCVRRCRLPLRLP